jgi:hypothetical protein
MTILWRRNLATNWKSFSGKTYLGSIEKNKTIIYINKKL